MAHGVAQERASERGEEMTEEGFLKDLYLHMKNRDTPIERVPHLGFKQIDLFLMYQTVKELGGYHQVTSQQLWKQVYNTLGGNPRSTSAATCTRRHYEKLLLPYECYVKGGQFMKIFPHDQTRDGQQRRPAKRRFPPVNNPNNPMSDLNGTAVPYMHIPYPHYYHQSPPELPPFIPVSPSVLTPPSPPTFGSSFSFPPSPQTSMEALQYLRNRAKHYNALQSSGLNEPLNLSRRDPSGEPNSQPASSFSTPPKFLNEPSPLYPVKKRSRDESCEAQSAESGEEGSGFSSMLNSFGHKEAFGLGSVSTPASGSFLSAATPTLKTDPPPCPTPGDPEDMSTLTYPAGSPKATFPKAWREESAKPCQSPPSLCQPFSVTPRENGGPMEIQIPLSLLHECIRMYASSTCAREENRRASPDEDSRERSWYSSDKLTFNMASHPREPDRRSITRDAVRGSLPSSTSETLTISDATGPHRLPSSNPMSSGDILNKAHPWEQQHLPVPHKLKTITRPDQNLLSSKSQASIEDMAQDKVLMLKSGAGSLLHLTSEELMKLKKIISSLS